MLDRGSLSMGYDHRGATTPHIVPTMQGEIAMSEDCCWTWIRDHCPLKRSGNCDCECHTTYPEPPDWKARAEKAEAELAAAVAQVEQLRPVIAGLMRRRLPNGDPCWCSEAEVQAHYPAHGYWCSKARTALSSQAAAPVAGGGGE